MNDFDNDFNEYFKKMERIMWKGLGTTLIIGLIALIIFIICLK